MYTIDQVRTAVMNKWDWENPVNNIPIIIWGPPGIGKTELVFDIVAQRKINELENNKSLSDKEKSDLHVLKNYSSVKQIEKILKDNVLVLRLAERPIEQIEGIPAPNFQNKSTSFLMPENLVQLKNAKWVVLFIDELDKASESKMAAATHLIESNIIGDFCLPEDTFIVCAANRIQDSWLSKPVSPELCNRMAHVELEPDIESFTKWGKKHGVRDEFLKFLKFKNMQRENYLYRNISLADGDSPRQFASPRSWYKASLQVNKVYTKYGNNDKVLYNECRREVEQFLGENITTELYTYLDLYSKVDIRKILSGEVRIPKSENKKDTISEQYVFAFVLAEQLKEEDVNKNTLSNIITAIEDMYDELRTVFIQMLHVNNEKVLKKIVNSKEANKVVDKIISYIAGV